MHTNLLAFAVPLFVSLMLAEYYYSRKNNVLFTISRSRHAWQ